MIHLLDYNGLKKLWEKIKSTFVSKPTEELRGGFLQLQEDGSAKWMNLPTVFTLKGRKDSYDDLPTDAENGDVYLVGNAEYYWNGTSWDYLGEVQDAQVQADWNEEDNEAPSYIHNKPSIKNYNYQLEDGIYKAAFDLGDSTRINPQLILQPSQIQSYYGTSKADENTFRAGHSALYILDPSNHVILHKENKGTDNQTLYIGSGGNLLLRGSGIKEGGGSYPQITVDANITLDVNNGSLLIKTESSTVEIDEVGLDLLKNYITNREVYGTVDNPFTIIAPDPNGNIESIELSATEIVKLKGLLGLSATQISNIKSIATTTNISKLNAISFLDESATQVSAGNDYQLVLHGNTIKLFCEDGEVTLTGSDLLKLKSLISQ